jgi:hypothetical protein
MFCGFSACALKENVIFFSKSIKRKKLKKSKRKRNATKWRILSVTSRKYLDEWNSSLTGRQTDSCIRIQPELREEKTNG